MSDGAKEGRESPQVTSDFNCFTKADLYDFLMVPSSWKRKIGMENTGCDSTCSMVTSSLHFAKISARLNTSYGFIWAKSISSDLYLMFVFVVML